VRGCLFHGIVYLCYISSLLVWAGLLFLVGSDAPLLSLCLLRFSFVFVWYFFRVGPLAWIIQGVVQYSVTIRQIDTDVVQCISRYSLEVLIIKLFFLPFHDDVAWAGLAVRRAWLDVAWMQSVSVQVQFVSVQVV
jgi:hypothetical protein